MNGDGRTVTEQITAAQQQFLADMQIQFTVKMNIAATAQGNTVNRRQLRQQLRANDQTIGERGGCRTAKRDRAARCRSGASSAT